MKATRCFSIEYRDYVKCAATTEPELGNMARELRMWRKEVQRRSPPPQAVTVVCEGTNRPFSRGWVLPIVFLFSSLKIPPPLAK